MTGEETLTKPKPAATLILVRPHGDAFQAKFPKAMADSAISAEIGSRQKEQQTTPLAPKRSGWMEGIFILFHPRRCLMPQRLPCHKPGRLSCSCRHA